MHSTLREAVDRGYECVTVADATAASRPENQAPALAMIAVEGGIFGRKDGHTATVDLLRQTTKDNA
ncbi:MAG: isochorismatase family protein [Burkholderiaceae bacterium]